MNRQDIPQILEIMNERFRKDTVLALATTVGDVPSVRMVNSYYENGSFYTITYAVSNKMKQIEKNSKIAICGEWFTAHGTGENLGWICSESNKPLAEKLRNAFSS